MKTGKLIRFAALLSTLILMLSSCTLFQNVLTYDKATNIFTDKKTGAQYTDAPFCYEPVKLGEEYARWKISGENVIFYEIDGMDPLLWLTEEGNTVFYAKGVTLPSLSEMSPYSIYICIEQELTVVLAEIVDSAEITQIVSQWENGDTTAYPGTTPEATYRIKFLSNKYPGLYYNLIYVSYNDGNAYLYNRDSGRCVAAGDIIDSYING